MTAHSYTLEELQQEYDKADLQQAGRKQIVNDDELEEETYWLLNEKLWFWPYVWLGIWIFAILIVGVIGE